MKRMLSRLWAPVFGYDFPLVINTSRGHDVGYARLPTAPITVPPSSTAARQTLVELKKQNIYESLQTLPELDEIQDGIYDFSRLLKLLAFPSLVGFAWTAYKSTEYFLYYGNKSAELIPGPEFLSSITAPSTFGVNADLNFYFLLDTTLKIHEILVTLHLLFKYGRISGKKFTVLLSKTVVALAAALAASLPSYFMALADPNSDKLQQDTTLIVNAVLSLLGAYGFIEAAMWVFSAALRKISARNQEREITEEAIAAVIADMQQHIVEFELLDDRQPAKQKAIPSDCNVLFTGSIAHDDSSESDDDDESAGLIRHQTNTNNPSWLTTLTKFVWNIVSHGVGQAANVASCVGMWRNTVDGMGNPHSLIHIGNPAAMIIPQACSNPKAFHLPAYLPQSQWGLVFYPPNPWQQTVLGSALFVPPMSLYVRVVAGIVSDLKSMLAQALTWLWQSDNKKSKPALYGWKQHSLDAVTVALMLVNIVAAWYSSGGAVAQNATYCLTSFDSRLLTCFGTLLFNAYAGKEMIMTGRQLCMQYGFFTAKKRHLIARAKEVTHYIETSLNEEMLQKINTASFSQNA